MKKILASISAAMRLTTPLACSGSDEIIGTWNAQVADGTELV